MKVGVLLPTFQASAEPALEAAERAADAGLDGVFAYDHLWPMGSPQRPALAPFPVLAAIAARHESLVVGPLVARVGLVSTHHLVAAFTTLATVAPGRVIAAIGTGDRLSADENLAYGISTLDAASRRALLAETARELTGSMPVWFGAGASATNELARELGVTVNLWNATVEAVKDQAAEGPVSWAGPVPTPASRTADLLDDLARAGVSWVVLGADLDLESFREWRASN